MIFKPTGRSRRRRRSRRGPRRRRPHPVPLLCAPFKGGTANYMSEELAWLRRALAAAKTDEEYRRIKLEKLVTAATTDLVAAALLTLELYMQSNRWPLIMLNATEAAGVDAKRALEIARKLIAKPALAEVEAWGSEELSEWLCREKMLSRLQPMALDGSITVRALLDAVVVGGDMKAVVRFRRVQSAGGAPREGGRASSTRL